MSDGGARPVWSTGPDGSGPADAICERCGKAPCRCAENHRLPPERHVVHVRRDRRGRRGKTVTVAGPFHVGRVAAGDLLRDLKRRCGSGGTLRGDEDGFTLEIQGDRVQPVLDLLVRLGYPARQAGG